MSAPKFGDWLRGIYAGERNPQRDGMYVRTVRRAGRLNPGTYYELTDGQGNFWQYPAESTEPLPARATPAPAVGDGRDAQDAARYRLLMSDENLSNPGALNARVAALREELGYGFPLRKLWERAIDAALTQGDRHE